MRLWHYKLIPVLPKSQLLAQWREINSILKKQDKHILINYVYNYDKEYLRTYAWDVINEMLRRGIKVETMDNMANYFGKVTFDKCDTTLRFSEHNTRYLRQNYYNLQEKFDRGQKDLDEVQFFAIFNACAKEIARHGTEVDE